MLRNSNNPAFINQFLTIEQLDAMSKEQLNRYCFISGNKTEWDEDFDSEIVDNIDNYDLIKTLTGQPLGYIKTKIDYNMLSWLPAGKKLNPRLIYTLQSILAKNMTQVRNASLTGEANLHISKSCTRLTEVINKAFENDLVVDEE